jgi:hypothetical protein
MYDALAISWRSASKHGARRALMRQRGSKALGALRAADTSPATLSGLAGLEGRRERLATRIGQ